jgi:hypothetical protein
VTHKLRYLPVFGKVSRHGALSVPGAIRDQRSEDLKPCRGVAFTPQRSTLSLRPQGLKAHWFVVRSLTIQTTPILERFPPKALRVDMLLKGLGYDLNYGNIWLQEITVSDSWRLLKQPRNLAQRSTTGMPLPRVFDTNGVRWSD